MDSTKCIAALFDFDGVVMDTEWQYSKFWNLYGHIYFPGMENMDQQIKGNTLFHIFEKYLSHSPELQKQLAEHLDSYEKEMEYVFLPGLERLWQELRAEGIKIAIVTSSTNQKMSNVYAKHPELPGMVDKILTADCFTKSKPHPECFLLGAEVFDTVPENCVVFEDSFNGLAAGNAAGMKVVGLSTTNPNEAICDKAHVVIPDFENFSVADIKRLLE